MLEPTQTTESGLEREVTWRRFMLQVHHDRCTGAPSAGQRFATNCGERVSELIDAGGFLLQ
jgi:hypothetical protein